MPQLTSLGHRCALPPATRRVDAGSSTDRHGCRVGTEAPASQLCGAAKAKAAMSDKRNEKPERAIECPSCGCRHLYVLYTRHRAHTIIRARICRYCQRRVVTHERVIGAGPDGDAKRWCNRSRPVGDWLIFRPVSHCSQTMVRSPKNVPVPFRSRGTVPVNGYNAGRDQRPQSRKKVV